MARTHVFGAKRLRPGLGIPRADVHQFSLGVVRNSIPHGTAAPKLPPLTIPGCRRLAHGFTLEAFGGIAGNGIKPPDLLSRLGVICGEEAACRTVAARC